MGILDQYLPQPSCQVSLLVPIDGGTGSPKASTRSWIVLGFLPSKSVKVSPDSAKVGLALTYWTYFVRSSSSTARGTAFWPGPLNLLKSEGDRPITLALLCSGSWNLPSR